MAIDERTADLLAAIASPFRLQGGPDFVLSQRAPGQPPVAGATLWLQNPTDRPLPVRFVVTVTDGRGPGLDIFTGTLAPLEVGALAVPVSIRFKHPHAVKFLVVSEARGRDRSADPPRIRAASPGHLDREATAKGILVGLAGLALSGVGHFTTTRVGGDVGTIFDASWVIEGADPSSSAGGAAASWTRLWAPAGSPSTTFTHKATPQRVRVTAKRAEWGVPLVAFILAMLAFSLVTPAAGTFVAVAVAIAVFVAAAYGIIAILRNRFPQLYASELIEPLVARDGEGVVRA